MTGPVVRLCLRLRKDLKAAREANQRLLFHVARQEAVIANLQADRTSMAQIVRALSETCPSTIEELQSDG